MDEVSGGAARAVALINASNAIADQFIVLMVRSIQ